MRSLINRFQSDRRGTIAIVFGFSAFVLFGTIGLAIDQSKAFNTKSRMTSALEASALAAAKLLDADENASDSDIEALAKRYFEAHVATYELEETKFDDFKATPDRDTGTVTAQVDVEVGTIFGRLFNIQPTLNFTPEVAVSFSAKKVEIVLVLDVTGSMDAPGKLDALKTAAKTMVEGLYASNPHFGAVRVGMVPYAGAVNAGTYASAIRRSHYPMADDDGHHGDVYPTDNCVVERGGVAAFSDAPPGSGLLGFSNTTYNWAYNCPVDEIVPLTDLSNTVDRDSFKMKIDALTPLGGTAGHIGLGLGWLMLSPNWASVWPTDPRPYDSDNFIKAIVFMTDGMLNLAYENSGNDYAYGTPQSVDRNVAGSSPYQALKLCDNMSRLASEDRQIKIFSVAFQAPSDAETLLQDCAGTDRYYTADNAAELISAFQQIVQNLVSMQLES